MCKTLSTSTAKAGSSKESDLDGPCNGGIIIHTVTNEELMNYMAQTSGKGKNADHNNRGSKSAPDFGSMTNDQIQEYLISKFKDVELTVNDENSASNKNFYQNSAAFPNIPPLTNHFSNTDLANLLKHHAYKDSFNSNEQLVNLAHAMSIGESQNSLFSTDSSSSSDSSPDGSSSDDGMPFIMPLSHKGTLTATGDDGKVRLIVPVSPSESTTEVGEKSEEKDSYAATLKVPEFGPSLAPNAPITRSTSEKVPNRSEMMTALRAQWTRHTTK